MVVVQSVVITAQVFTPPSVCRHFLMTLHQELPQVDAACIWWETGCGV